MHQPFPVYFLKKEKNQIIFYYFVLDNNIVQNKKKTNTIVFQLATTTKKKLTVFTFSYSSMIILITLKRKKHTFKTFVKTPYIIGYDFFLYLQISFSFTLNTNISIDVHLKRKTSDSLFFDIFSYMVEKHLKQFLNSFQINIKIDEKKTMFSQHKNKPFNHQENPSNIYIYIYIYFTVKHFN